MQVRFIKPFIFGLFLFVSLLYREPATAQFVNYGTDPSRLKWRSVQTEHFNLIYPLGNDSMAYRYAQLLETAYPRIGKTMNGYKKEHFPVILHPGNMLSNGLVAWAPKRMELITTPSSDLYAQCWDRQLVLHESRHVLQTEKLVHGIMKPFNYLIGQQTAGLAGFGVPKWFFEGDAVVTETALSNSGRGRLPEFHMAYRAQAMSEDFFSFDKWFLGSYKDYTGDYYALGYNLTAFARRQYGADIWDKVTSRYPRRILNLPPFSNALKHYTGVNSKGLFNQTFSFLKQEWEKQEETYRLSGFNPEYVSPYSRHYTSYQYPQYVDDSTVIALKSGLRDLKSIVRLRGDREQRLKYVGNINSRLVLRHNRVYWTEYVAGLRWTHENYSVLKYLDLESHKIVTLTPSQRYLAPSVAPDGKIAAVSEFTPEGMNRVVLIDINTGDSIARYAVPESGFVKETAFGKEGMVYTVAVGNRGIGIWSLNTASGEWTELLKPGSVNITSLMVSDDDLFFESGLSGTNNIYRFNIQDKVGYPVTHSRFGAFSPSLSPSGDRLLFSDYTARGYRVASVRTDTLEPEPVDFSRPYRFELAEIVAEQEQFNMDTASLRTVDFEPKPYRKGLHLFKIHSWAPFFYDASDAVNMQADDFTTIVKPGAMILSQNALNTAITQAGWYYKDGNHYGRLSFTYMGRYPVFDLKADYGGKAIDFAWIKSEESGRENMYGRYADRHLFEAEARMYIPFNFTDNHYIKGFQPSVSYYYTNNRYQQYESRKFRDFQYLLSELRFYHYRKMAVRDIFPRLGYQLRLNYLTTPFNTENYGGVYAVRLTGYLPGLIRNDGLMIRAAYQYQDVDNKALYVPKRIIEKTRGYDYIYQTRQQWALKADYSFNVFSPDVALGGLAYLKRVRSNVFYDLTRNQMHKKSGWTNQSSYGADLIFDCNFLRLNYPLSLGIRMINPIDYGNFQTEGLFSISF